MKAYIDDWPLAYGQGGLKLEINIPPQQILEKSKGVLTSSEYSMANLKHDKWRTWINFKTSEEELESILRQVKNLNQL